MLIMLAFDFSYVTVKFSPLTTATAQSFIAFEVAVPSNCVWYLIRKRAIFFWIMGVH
jgi:hypothetical protein